MSSDNLPPNTPKTATRPVLQSALSRGMVALLALGLVSAMVILGVFISRSIDQMQNNIVLTQASIDFSERSYTIIQRHLLRLQNALVRPDVTASELTPLRSFANNSINSLGNPAIQQTLIPELRPETLQAVAYWRDTLNPQLLQLIEDVDDVALRQTVLTEIEAHEILWTDLSTRNEIARKEQAGILNRNIADVLAQLQTLLVALAITGAVLVAFLVFVTATVVNSNRQLRTAQSALQELNRELEARVAQRTRDLQHALEDAEKARASAETANKVKSQFLASVSHELRTPLNAILNFTQFVIKGMAGEVNDEQVELLTQVTSSGEHLLRIINDVLDISKIEAGALELFVEADVDISAEIAHVMTLGKVILGEKSVTLKSEVAPDLPRITGDRQRIYQIILNLVANACKFTEQGSITVRANHQAEHDALLITVTDTGPGIALADQSLIFKNFQQTRIGMEKGGTGLGLPISSRLAEAHGGKLWVESTVGEGATFYVQLPIRPEHLKPTVRTSKERGKTA